MITNIHGNKLYAAISPMFPLYQRVSVINGFVNHTITEKILARVAVVKYRVQNHAPIPPIKRNAHTRTAKVVSYEIFKNENGTERIFANG